MHHVLSVNDFFNQGGRDACHSSAEALRFFPAKLEAEGEDAIFNTLLSALMM